MAVEMDGQDSLGAWGNGAFDQFGIQIKCGIIDIDVNWPCPDVGNRPARGNKGEWRGDDFSARAHLEQSHRHMQRRGAVVETDTMLGAAEAGEVFLKLSHIRPEAEGAIIERTRDGGVEVFADGQDLRRQIEVRDGSGS